MNTNIKLNMEEKKKLEKLAIEDIQKMIQKLRVAKSEAENKFEDKPTPEVKKMFDTWCKLDKDERDMKKKLEEKGYSVASPYGDNGAKLKLNTYGNCNKELSVVKESWANKIDKAENMKREVVISLYTTGQEAQEFLNNLSKKLEALLK